MSGPNGLWLAPLLALTLACALTPIVRRLLVRRRWLDYPDERRLHDRPTPRGGGLAVLVGLVVAVVSLIRFDPGVWVVVGLALALGGLGWLDDRRDVAVRWRLLAQLVIALSMVVSVGGITELRLGSWLLESFWLWNLLAVVAAVWLINLHNFMDGADGLASMQGVWTGLAFGTVFAGSGLTSEAFIAWSVAAAYAGFLVWNRPPARIFMGDSGSLLLGGMVAWLAISGVASGQVSVAVSGLICLVFVVDATATLLRRLIRGERWYTPHRKHAYQSLIRRGWRPRRVLALYALINCGLVLPAVVLATAFPAGELWLAGALAGTLAVGWWVVQSAEKGEDETDD